jgi:hypothetical protein
VTAIKTSLWIEQGSVGGVDAGRWSLLPLGRIVDRGWQYDLSGNLVIQIALYPDIVWLAAHNLQSPSTGRRNCARPCQ